MDSRGLPMYQHPRMTLMGQSDNHSVPGPIPMNYQMGNSVLGTMGMQGAPMSDNHANFNQNTHFNKMTAQQHYSQPQVRNEDDQEGRICGVVLPETPAHRSTEDNDAAQLLTEENNEAHLPSEENNPDDLPTEENDDIKKEDIKTEKEEDIHNFMELAHDLFLKVSSKELKIKEVADLLDRPYSFVYSRFQEFCDNVTGKVTMKKKKKGSKKKKGGKETRGRKKSKLTSKNKSGRVFQCEECPAIFRTEYMIKAHSKVHLKENESHLCTACGIVFSRLGQLMNHRIETHDDALQCPHCEKQYTAIKAYKFHVNTHTAVRPFPCDQCSKGFFSRVSLENHLRQHTGEKPFMCGYCEKVFTNLSNLKVHQYVHTGENKPKRKKRMDMPKNFECPECGRRFESNNRLGQHMNTHTGAQPYACDLCDTRFNLKANLYRHKLVHAGVKPFKCNYCSAAFLFKSELRLHDMSHTGLKPFKCTMCDYSCVRKHKLEYHMNTHTGATPFKCDFYGCNAEYSSPSTLKQHKLKHGPPPLRTCKVCNEKFPDLNSLKQHMVIHPGNKPVPCDQCDKIFFNESTLKRHMHVHMYKRHKNNVVIKRKRNPGIKRAVKPVAPPRKEPTEYQVPVAAVNGHSSMAQSWTINAEDTNSQHSQQTFNHPFPSSQFSNLNAWPPTVDPDELRRRLLSSFSNFNEY